MELKGNNFFVRAYTTRENSGDTYAAGFLANLLNESWKPSQTWYPQYVGAFAAATAAGQNATQAHLTARGVADQGRPAPGSSEFDRFKNEIVGVPIGLGQGGRPLGGAGFRDRTNMYHAEFMYNFMDKIKFMELIVGGNFRQYDLNSGGTLFATQDGRPTGQEFNINEFGGYAQASKKLMNERLKLSASLRFDKSQNFDIQYSPRASAVYTFLDNHNIRASFQTGFRIPTTQAQYIDLITPQARLIGGLPFQREASATGYNFTNNPVYTIENVTAFGNAFRATATNPATQQQAVQQVLPQAQQLVTQQVQAGQIPNNPEAIAAAVQATVAQLAPQAVAAIALQANRNILQPVQFRPYQPERVQAYEIGYKGLISSKLFIDAYYYFNNYRNFDGGQVVIQSNVGLVADANQTRDKANRFTEPSAITPLGLIGLGGTQGQPTRSVYSLPINLQQDIRTSGWGIGVNYALPKNYTIGGNIANNTILNEGDLGSLQSFWNTPRYRANLQFGNREIVRNLGFNITWRWQDQTIWQGTFVQQVVSERRLSVVPGFHTFDAQVSYKISPIKSILKIGGSNIFNNYYTQAWGNPAVGGLYYISLTFDEFLN
jgi:outer membrane receptor protein involved in Fe transport